MSYTNQKFSPSMENYSAKQLNFISALNEFLAFINTQRERSKILDDQFVNDNIENDDTSGRDLVTLLKERCDQHLPFNDVLFEPVKRFQRLANSLTADDWMEKFQTFSKEICKKLVLPFTAIEEKTEGGRRILVIKGAAVFISQITSQIVPLLSKVQEVQIIGLSTVHVDCNLDNFIWHGINIVVIAEKIFVASEENFLWDVSGRHDYFLPEKAENGQNPGYDGCAGEHGLPGESGGNVYILCNEMFNTKNWTIKSNGYRGYDGQDGGDGTDGKDGEDGFDSTLKQSKNDFKKLFPPLNSIFSNQSAISITLTSIISNAKKVMEFNSTILGNVDKYFIKGFMQDSTAFTASLWKKNSFIICQGASGSKGQIGGRGGQGGKGGQGGYGGTITIQKLNGEPFVVDGLRIGEEIQSTAVSTGASGPSGLDGKDGKGGKCGKSGRSSSDFGYIDNMNNCASSSANGSWKKGLEYFGFDDKILKFDIQYLDLCDPELSSLEHPYTLCNLDGKNSEGKKLVRYAVLYPLEYLPDELWMTHNAKLTCQGRQKLTQEEALKKKAITGQSLIHHLNQIAERKNANKRMMMRVLWLLPMDELTDQDQQMTVAEQAEFTLFSMTCVEQQFKKSIDSRLIMENETRPKSSFKNSKIQSNKNNNPEVYDFEELKMLEQIDNDEELHHLPTISKLIFQHFSAFLEPQSTGDDDHHHSITHAALGKRDDQSHGGNYVFKNINNFIRELQNRGEHLCQDRSVTRDFVLRLKSVNDKNSKYLKRFKKGLAMKNKYLEELKVDFWQPIEDKWAEFETEIERTENEELACLLGKHLTSKEKVTLLLRRCLDDDDIKDLDSNACQETRECLIKTSTDFDNNFRLKNLIEELKKNFDWTGTGLSLSNEYIHFLRSETWGLPELLIIKNQQLVFYIYENRDDGYWISRLVGDENSTERVFLCLNRGVWQRLEFNPGIECYFQQRLNQIQNFQRHYEVKQNEISLLECSGVTVSESNHHAKLIQFLDVRYVSKMLIRQRMMTCIRMFNPEYGQTPDELSRLLLKHLSSYSWSENQLMDEQLATNIIMLAEKVMDYNIRSIEPIFYLQVVANLSSRRWKYEFVLQEMEERMKLVLQPEDRKSWRRCLFKLSDEMLNLLRNKLASAGKPGHPPLKPDNLGQTLLVLAEQVDLISEDLVRLERLPLNTWYLELRSKVWQKQIEFLSSKSCDSLVVEEKKEVIYLLLELENKKGETFCQQLLDQVFCINSPLNSLCWSEFLKILRENMYSDTECFSSETTIISEKERTLEEIISKMKSERGGDTSEQVACQLDTNEAEILAICNKLDNLKRGHLFDDDVLNSLESFNSLEQIKNWAGKKKSQVLNNDQEMGNFEDNIRIFLYVYIRAVQLKMDIRLRNTQSVAIMTLLKAGHNNTLAQVPTGEGKSLIVAALAIYHALNNKKVDVITNNNVLAKRDSTLSVIQGGLRDLYEIFNIDVAHNCIDAEHDRIKAYDSAVVYGELSNFQCDYLLDHYYGRNLRGDRTFDCVIVDEVDCMLLDRGNNILYLSHEIPGMEMLESLYVFIWEKIRTTHDSLDDIKSAILYDLYGEITKEDLTMVLPTLQDRINEKEFLWSHLIKIKVLDMNGRLLVKDVDRITENLFSYFKNPKLNPRLVFFFRNVLKRDRRIRIPKHLLSFVDRHLDTFLDNAMRALILNADEHYVVDHNWASSNTSDPNPQVIIIDSNTGTDQAMSQWDGGLHQFLQLKEGCRLTLQSLKSVFISNVTFIKRYKSLAGLSGTLGSRPERTFLRDMYHCDFFTIPTAFRKTFIINPAIVVKTESIWLEAIIQETHRILFEENRSLVIFCRSIKEVSHVYQQLRNKYQEPTQIHRYTRDYEQFQFGGQNELEVGHVIVATNLAGRGTDIKINQELRSNGGLHICLTYLPDNVRIEEQAMGRAGRKKDPGSGRLIILSLDNSDEMGAEGEWSKDKIFDMKEERNRQELHRISLLLEDFYCRIDKQEKCFDEFWKQFREIENQLTKDVKHSNIRVVNIISRSVFDRWALWLDKIDDNLSNNTSFESYNLEKLLKRLKSELIDQLPKNLLANLNWMTPARSIVLAKYYATRAPKPDFTKAASLLDHLINSKDKFFYPAAYYYRAFVHIKENGFRKQKKELIKLLRATKKILEQHIEMHQKFCIIVDQQPKGLANNKHSFYVVEAYKEQKENAIKILHYFFSSIQSLLGFSFSVSDLEKIGFDAGKARNYFQSLVDSGLITQYQINDILTVPDRDFVLGKVANNFGVAQSILENFLSEEIKYKNLSEEMVLEKAEKSDMFRCTRRKFWNYLVDCQVLIVSKASDNCFVPNFKPEKCVLFDPTPDNINMFVEKKEQIGNLEFGQLQMEKLKSIDLTLFGSLADPADLSAITNNEMERFSIWKSLTDKKIIDRNGKLSLEYNEGMTFNYPNCPIYEKAVMSLIERTYIAEIIRRRWLNEEDPIQRMKIIAYLPLEPYKDLLSDLEADHIISGTKVTEKYICLKDEVKDIIKNKEERKQIISFLENHQSTFSKIETPIASLISVDRASSDSNDKLVEKAAISELNAFRLIGFNDVIILSEKKWSTKMKIRSAILLSIGVVLVIAAIAIYLHKLAGIPGLFINPIASFMLYKGISDAWFAISALKSGKNFSWADYRREMFKKPAVFHNKWKTRFVSRVVNHFSHGIKTVEVDRVEKNSSTIDSNNENVEICVNRVVKSSCFHINQAMSVGRLNGQIESIINSKLDILERRLRAELNQEITQVINEIFASTTMGIFWGKFYQLWETPVEVEYIVEKETKRVTEEWAEQAQLFLCKFLDYLEMEMVNSLSNESFEQIETPVLMADKLSKIIKQVLNKFNLVQRVGNDIVTIEIKRFYAGLESYFSGSHVVHSKLSEEEIGKSRQKLQADLIFKLEENAMKSMEYLKTNILLLVSKHVVAMTTKFVKKIYQERDKLYDHGLKLLEEERCAQWIERAATDPVEDQQSNCYAEISLNLMKKTNDPNLLASLIREKSVPYDPFCTAGLKNALPIIKSRYSELNTLVLIRLNEKVADLIENDTEVSRAIRIGWRNYNKQKCPFQTFIIIGGFGCTDTDCELRGLTEYPGYVQYVEEAVMGPNNVESFHAMRKHFLFRHDYKNTIWLNIKTYVLPIVKRLRSAERKKEFIQAALKHIKGFSITQLNENDIKSPITPKEAEELEEKFYLCVS